MRWIILLVALLHDPAVAMAEHVRYTSATSKDPLVVEPMVNTNAARNLQNGSVPEYNQEIRGGFEVTEVIPWYVVFADTVICGGALIHKDIAITAAHCVNNGFPSSLRIGSLSRSSGGTVVSVTTGLRHPSWSGSVTNGADIAVMKLSSSLSNRVAALNMAGTSPADGNNLFIAGFGLVDDNSLSQNLRGLFLDYVSSCASRIDSYNSAYHVCGDATPDAGTCAGDSGSPVFLTGTDTIVGLNSYSDNSCESQNIDVYTRVSTYASWVSQQVCSLSSDPPASCSTSGGGINVPPADGGDSGGDDSGGGNDDSGNDDGDGCWFWPFDFGRSWLFGDV